jgi:hypothetical protein
MRRFALVGIWGAATALAVGVAWAGVQLVARQVVDPIPLAVSATPATTPPAVATSPADTPAPEPTAELRTYQLQGGTVSVSYSPDGVEVVQGTPQTGFTRKVEPEGPGIRVEFESDGHRSRLDAWWDGAPRERIREDTRD